MPFELIGNHIYVHALLNGKGPYYFALDTGAHDVVTLPVAEGLGLEPTTRTFRRLDGRTLTYKTWPSLDSIQVGDLILRDQPFAVIPFDNFNNVEGMTPFGGLLGYELLKTFVVKIDYEHSRLTFTKPDQFQPPPASGAALPLTFLEDIPQVPAQVDGVAGVFNIDTGDRRSLQLFRDFVAQNNLREKYAPCVQAMTGWGVRGPVHSDLARARRFEIGGFQVTRPVVQMDVPTGGAFDFPRTAGNVGADLLRQFTVTFDYSRKRMYLEKNGDFGRPITFDRAGLWLNQRGAQFIVIGVTEKGPAAQAGIIVGDTVTAIDGKPAALLSLPSVRRTLREGAPGTRVPFMIQSKGSGQTRTVVVTLRDLI